MQHITIPHTHGKQENMQDVQRTLENKTPFEEAAAIFRAMADDTRIQLFWILCHREECVLNLSALLHLSSPAVSHHLRSLIALGLIEGKRMGKEVHYHAAETEVCRLLHLMVEQVMEISCPREKVLSNQEIAVQVHDYLTSHLDSRLTIASLALQFHVNPTTLKQSFKEKYGISMAAHMKEHRLAAAAQLLKNSNDSVSAIANQVGFVSQSRFTEAFREKFGCLPREYRKKP